MVSDPRDKAFVLITNYDLFGSAFFRFAVRSMMVRIMAVNAKAVSLEACKPTIDAFPTHWMASLGSHMTIMLAFYVRSENCFLPIRKTRSCSIYCCKVLSL